MKQDIAIDRLLVWAYRDQKAHLLAKTRFTPQGPNVSLSTGIAEFMRLGCRVQASSRAEMVLAAERLREGMPDLMRIDAAVMALAEMWVADDGAIWTHERAAMAGCTVERVPGGFVLARGGETWPITQACTHALVELAARNDEVPEWYPDYRPPAHRAASSADADARGRKRKIYEGPSACEVALARALYAVWHAALCDLAGDLADALADWHPLPPSSAAEPWRVAGKRSKSPEENKHQAVEIMQEMG